MTNQKPAAMDAQRATRVLRAYMDEKCSERAGEPVVHGPIAERDYSMIFRVEHPGLPTAGALKLCLDSKTSAPDPRSAAHQFAVLERLYRESEKQDIRLVPRPYCLMPAEGGLLIEWIPGKTMADGLFRWHAGGAMDLVAKAADWLRDFHSICPSPVATLDVEEKLAALAALERDSFPGNRLVRRCYACLREYAGAAGSLELKKSRLHGDFKAENLILAGPEVVGIDVQTRSEHVVVYDIAHFFNDIELNSHSRLYWRAAHIQDKLYGRFLDRYFEGAQPALELPLLWIRIYMLLSAWSTVKKQSQGSLRGRYLQRSYKSATRRVLAELSSYG